MFESRLGCQLYLSSKKRKLIITTSFTHPTPIYIAYTIDPNRRTVVVTVTSHSRRSIRNIGTPIRKIEPKNRTRYGTRMSLRIGDRNSAFHMYSTKIMNTTNARNTARPIQCRHPDFSFMKATTAIAAGIESVTIPYPRR